MASATRAVRVRFDGDSKGLTAAAGVAGTALEAMNRNAVKSSQGFQSFITKAAMLAPVIGATLGATAGLSGVLGLIPSVAFAGALGLGALMIGTSGFGDAIKAMSDPAKFAEAVGKLSPNARLAAEAVRGLKPQLDGLKNAVQDRLFAGFNTLIGDLGRALLPAVGDALGYTAMLFNSTARSFVRWATMPGTVGDLRVALQGANSFLDGMLRAVQPLTQAFLDIGVVAAPYMARLGEIIAGAAQRFADFVRTARESGALNEWIKQGVDTFSKLWNVLKMVAQAVWNIAIAFGSSGLPSVLELVAGALLRVSQFIRDNSAMMFPLITVITLLVFAFKGIMVVVSIIRVIGLLVLAFKGIMFVLGIVNAVRTATILWTAAQWLLNAALLANPIGLIVLAIAAIIAIIVLLIMNWDWVKAKATEVVVWCFLRWAELQNWLAGIWSNMRAFAFSIFAAISAWIANRVMDILQAISWLGALPGRIAGWFNDMRNRAVAAVVSLAAGVAQWFMNMRDRAVSAAQSLISWMAGLPGRLRSALGNLGSLLVSSGRAVVDGFLNGLKSTWNSVLSWAQNAMASLRSFWPFSPAKTGPFSGSGYVTHSANAMTTDFANALIAGTPKVMAAAAGLHAAARAAATPSMSGMGKAAQEILNRVRGGGQMFEDFTWRGASANVGKFNDDIAAGFYKNGQGFDGNSGPAIQRYLEQLIARESQPVNVYIGNERLNGHLDGRISEANRDLMRKVGA